MTGFLNIVKQCWSLWKEDDAQQRKRASEENNLYTFKIKTHHISSANTAEERDEIEKTFPSFNVDDNEGSCMDTSSSEMDQISSVLTTSSEAFSPEELHQICSLHISIFCNSSEGSVFQSLPQPPLETYYLASYLACHVQNLPGKLSLNFMLC